MTPFKRPQQKVYGLLLTAALATASPLPAFAEEPHHFEISTSSATQAIHQFGTQSGVQILASAEQLQDKKLNEVEGTLSTDDGLRQLLAGTGISHRYVGDRTVALVVDEPGASAQAEVASARTKESAEEEQGVQKKSFWDRFRLARADQGISTSSSTVNKDTQSSDQSYGSRVALEEVTVTGTTIKGAKVPSLVLSITADEMKLAGHANLGEAMRAVPQNYAGGQNPGIGIGAIGGAAGNANFTGSSSINLRGLGADATLTLLNGARMPYDGIIQATDVASIPLAAIDRVEILLDGASAIYGSDAVGGVANVILKRDYQGAEVSARHGVATDGGYEQQQYTAVMGTSWGSGGLLFTADYSKNTEVRARQRDYLDSMPNQNITIYPHSSQKGVLLSGHQDIGVGAELTLDAFYTDRRTRDVGQTSLIFDNERDPIIWGAAPALRFALPAQWSLQLNGAFGSNDNRIHLRVFDPITGAAYPNPNPVTSYLNETETAGVVAQGPLFALPGGQVQLAIGGGYRRSIFEQSQLATATTVVEGSTRSYHGYGEINLPLVSQDQGIKLVSRLALSGAVRHENYKSFGTVTTPKAGLIWGVTPGFDLKASWGKSFKAPTLTEQFSAAQLYLYPDFFLPGLPAGTNALLGFGGNPELEPERATVTTVGFVATPDFLPGFSVEVGWFDIDYMNRVVTPPPEQLANPAYAGFFTLNPTPAQQDAYFATLGLPSGVFTGNFSGAPYDPANVFAVLDSRYANAAVDHVNGVDIIVRYAIDAFGGRLSVNGNGSWMDATRQLTTLAPQIDAAGTIFFPAKFKGRFGTSWSRAGLTLASNINYLGGITNTNVSSRPKGGAMTTIDLIGDYRVRTGPLGEIAFNLAVLNVFNREPPLIQPTQPFYPPYDSTNYSPLGRTMGLTVTKQF